MTGNDGARHTLDQPIIWDICNMVEADTSSCPLDAQNMKVYHKELLWNFINLFVFLQETPALVKQYDDSV